jgi:hypothetical protein
VTVFLLRFTALQERRRRKGKKEKQINNFALILYVFFITTVCLKTERERSQ